MTEAEKKHELSDEDIKPKVEEAEDMPTIFALRTTSPSTATPSGEGCADR
jgi:hypothetical protein